MSFRYEIIFPPCTYIKIRLYFPFFSEIFLFSSKFAQRVEMWACRTPLQKRVYQSQFPRVDSQPRIWEEDGRGRGSHHYSINVILRRHDTSFPCVLCLIIEFQLLAYFVKINWIPRKRSPRQLNPSSNKTSKSLDNNI